VDESHFEHTGEILGGFLKSREDASAFLEPADQSLNDVALAIRLPIELNRSDIPILVFLGRNHWRDFQFQQAIVNPICSVCFVSGESNGPGNGLAVAIEYFGVCAIEQGNQGG
jgi:hypothetical protein